MLELMHYVLLVAHMGEVLFPLLYPILAPTGNKKMRTQIESPDITGCSVEYYAGVVLETTLNLSPIAFGDEMERSY